MCSEITNRPRPWSGAVANVQGKHWSISLYTTRKDIDVGAVARNQGGGGHKGAAGFQLKQLPPELMP